MNVSDRAKAVAGAVPAPLGSPASPRRATCWRFLLPSCACAFLLQFVHERKTPRVNTRDSLSSDTDTPTEPSPPPVRTASSIGPEPPPAPGPSPARISRQPGGRDGTGGSFSSQPCLGLGLPVCPPIPGFLLQHPRARLCAVARDALRLLPGNGTPERGVASGQIWRCSHPAKCLHPRTPGPPTATLFPPPCPQNVRRSPQLRALRYSSTGSREASPATCVALPLCLILVLTL
nr:SH3-containing GRB2-like protein 3-interacting protein 1 [Vicugna pacos]